MAFQDILQGAKRFFGPDNPFFHGTPEKYETTQPQEEPAPQVEAPMPPQPEQNYQQPAYQQQAYAPQQPQYQQQQAQPYQQQAPYQQPQQQYQPQPQQNTQNPFQQGYRPPQPQQQSVNEPYVAPRNRRAAQHQQMPPQQPQMDPNVVPFPGAAPQQPAQPVQPQKMPTACVINVRSIADCRNAIGILRSNDCVLAVMDSIADQAEVRRYVDTLNGACFSLGCSMTRLSSRVGVYILAPAGMTVYTDQATTQMNNQSRAPQRQQQRPMQSAQQQAFHPPYQQMQPQQGAYQQPSPYGQMQQQSYQQPQQAAPVFSAQSAAQGYTPDAAETAEYNAI